MEFMYRIAKLGYRLSRISNANCYHFEHSRGLDSRYNNFCRANELEYKNITAMKAEELRSYVDNGFRHLRLNSRLELTTINNSTTFSMRTERPAKQDLSCVSTIIAIKQLQNLPKPDLDYIFDYLEERFDNYLIVVTEVGSREFKYLRNKKNIQYLWLPPERTLDDAVDVALRSTDRDCIDSWKCTQGKDLEKLLPKYEFLLTGVDPADLFSSRRNPQLNLNCSLNLVQEP
jgi:hypothetical protein